MVEVLDCVNVVENVRKKRRVIIMKVEERKKKYIMGMTIYTLGIVQFAVLLALSMDVRSIWWLGLIGGVIFMPLAFIGQNLMVRQRWF